MGEGVDVWRPVEAENLGNGVFRILAQTYRRDNELWEFEPDDVVVGEVIDSGEGPFLAAVRKRDH
jgi:hypothetical protein